MVALTQADKNPLKVVRLPGKGRGLVASQGFRKGAEIEWAPVCAFPATERPAIDGTALFPYYFVRPADYHCAPLQAEGLIVLGLMTLCNHADAPNAAVQWLEEETGPAARLLALSDIAAGDEITLKYANLDAYSDSTAFV